MQIRRSTYVLLSALLVAVFVLSACSTPAATTMAPEATTAPTTAPTMAMATEVPTEAATVAPTEAPTEAPTAAPTTPAPVCDPLPNPPTVNAGDLGSSDNPIVIAFVPSGESGQIATASNAIADCLNKMTGLSYKVQTGTSYGAAIEAMGANQAQVGFLNTFSVLLAEEKYGIVPALANLRNYSTIDIDPDKDLAGQLEPFYKGQFIANVDSGIKTLADLKGKSFCFVDPNSTSGYIVPRIILKANGIDPDTDLSATENAGSHPNVAIAVYNGDCDAGVTYINVLTDAATNLQAQYPDITDKVKPFAVTDRIPNDGVQYTKDLPQDIQDITTNALLAMSQDPGGKAVLASLYTINAFEKIDATFYDDFANVLKAAGVDPASLVQ